MSDIDDIDERFRALTAQIDERERRRMNKAAAQEWARHPRRRRRRRLRNAAIAVAVLVAAAGILVSYRPDVVDQVRTAVSGWLSELTTGETAGTDEPAETARAKSGRTSPFDGSPAQGHADGAEGLIVPPVRAVGAEPQGGVRRHAAREEPPRGLAPGREGPCSRAEDDTPEACRELTSRT